MLANPNIGQVGDTDKMQTASLLEMLLLVARQHSDGINMKSPVSFLEGKNRMSSNCADQSVYSSALFAERILEIDLFILKSSYNFSTNQTHWGKK